MKAHQVSSLLLAALLAASPLVAEPLKKTPGATLIVPYFEVDLDAPDGRSTLVSVGNAGEPVVARATLWTDWGVPVYSWNLYLGENGVATYNLRDIVAFGNVAPTRAPAGFGGCGDPVVTPALPAAELAILQKQLTGQNLGGGMCASEPRLDQSLATGSLTIDTIIECRSGTRQRYPNDSGYFNGSRPLASPRQVLWGDFILVDPAENFAEGYEAFTLGIAATAGSPRFGGWPANLTVGREALNNDWNCSRMRFLQGGPFAAKTSFFVYTPPPKYSEAHRCSSGEGGRTRWVFKIFDESAQSQAVQVVESEYRTSGRVEAAADLGIGSSAGHVELVTYLSGDWGGVPEPSLPFQHLLFGAIEASGRFAVGVAGNPVGSNCH